MSDIPRIFDRTLIARHLSRRAATDDVFTKLIHQDLDDRLGTLKRRFENALAIGPTLELLPEHTATADGPVTFARLATIDTEDDDGLPDMAENQYDLIVSVLDLQVVNDVPGYLSRLARSLTPDGLLMAVALGGESLGELRRAFLEADTHIFGGAFARVAPFIPLRDAGGLLQRAGLALPVADVETHIVRYSDPLALMRELKALGAANPLVDRPNKMATRGLIARAMEAYGEAAMDDDGRVRATLELLWMSGWSPHENQQKPLKPGSATVSLTEVLKDKSKA
ncbi:methyltransferase [Devosia pacifica]|uniref:Methyltransferase n=1 Tax=Devosia pacifica TaxID=1335967 RepID=A0A918S881_9HYPH|nr:SAM-dependent methyltransferase [Devosia pacifica]GHA26770.1 methyltransferase [Devosia pacifica]